ncbi:unnamed protein product [Blepharisma stoltei]|uniref:protein-tyrosine-phosphatase n=1 Tax=Blepharisma stoltei TaxID=1481888 RepID=A0AAU9KGG2_9CILI|nr:unnamed protein product [Blepharisma stoltei]
MGYKPSIQGQYSRFVSANLPLLKSHVDAERIINSRTQTFSKDLLIEVWRDIPTDQKPDFPKYISSEFEDEPHQTKKEISTMRLKLYKTNFLKIATPKGSFNSNILTGRSTSRAATPSLAQSLSTKRINRLKLRTPLPSASSKRESPELIQIFTEFQTPTESSRKLTLKSSSPDTTRVKEKVRILKQKIKFPNENAVKYISKFFESDEGKQRLKPESQQYFGIISEIPYKLYLGLPERHGSLYITDIKGANDLSQLRKLHIYAILTLGLSNAPYVYTFIKGGYMTINIEDDEVYELPNVLPKATKFLDHHLKNGNVLVHDYYGMNRSCAVVVLYLMKKYSMKMYMAIKAVTEGRPCCDIRPEFKSLIERFQIRGEL